MLEQSILRILQRKRAKTLHQDHLTRSQILTLLEGIECTHPRKDLLTQSYKQYLAHKGESTVLEDIAAAGAMIPLILFLLLRPRQSTYLWPSSGGKKKAIGYDVIPETMPESIKSEFDIQLVPYAPGTLTLADLHYFLETAGPFLHRPFFLLKVLWKIGLYSSLVRTYRPSAVLCQNEYSFTSSFLTHYCEHLGIEHVNLEHGEKLYDKVDAFSTFHRFYVWDDYYAQILRDLHCPADQLIVELPAKFRKKSGVSPKGKKVFKYFGQVFDGQEHFRKVVDNCLSFIGDQGLLFKLRPHPLYGNYVDEAYLREKGGILDDIKNFGDSLEDADVVCGEFTAVMFEAHHKGKSIVIDDTRPGLKERLRDSGYILICKYQYPFLSGARA